MNATTEKKPTEENKIPSEAFSETDEINEEDVRDQADSSSDWDAEKSRTGRHK